MGEISNIELFRLSKEYDVSLIDVLMKDELDKPIAGNYIINLQSSTEGTGDHWLLLILNKKNSFYIDSFGQPPPNEVNNFVKRFNPKHFGYNTTQIQDLHSKDCGYFCLGFLLYYKHNKSSSIYQAFLNFSNLFDKDTKRNDGVLKGLFRVYSNTKIHNKLIGK